MDSSGYWYGMDGTYLYKVYIGANPTSGSLTFERIARSGTKTVLADLAFNPLNGSLYGMTGGKLLEVTPEGVGSFVTVSGTLSGSAGGAWSNATGTLYFYNNARGDLYGVDMTQTTPVASYVGSVPSNGQFDATGCSPVTLTKSVGSTVVAAGESFAYNFVITNPLPTDLIVSFTDDIPAGFTFVTDSLSPAAPGGGTVVTFTEETLTISSMVVPAGIAPANQVSFTVEALPSSTITSATAAPNQASISYGDNTTSSDDPDADGGATTVTVYGTDWGDAPDSYGNGKHMLVNTDYYLGATPPDADTQAQNTANGGADGTGDNSNGVADEDGVTIPLLVQGSSKTITVEVNQIAANDGYLQAWIDWNGDGDFLDTDEQIATDLQSATAGSSTISVSVTAPSTATSSQTYARFRWSTTAAIDSFVFAEDGEVEDYALSIDMVERPTQCGAFNSKGWVIGNSISTHGASVLFGSGTTTNDPYAAYALEQSADGKQLSSFGEPNETLTGSLPSTAGSQLVGSGWDEYHLSVFRLDGIAGSTADLVHKNSGTTWANRAFWVEDTAGNVLLYKDFAFTSGGNSAMSFTYPDDEVVFVYSAIFDSLGAYPAPKVTGFTCPNDHGDAPTDMSTIDASLTSTYGDASHTLNQSVYLGALIDIESGSQNSGLLADGDDIDGTDDDDGVTFELLGGTDVLRVDSNNVYSIEASVDGFLNAWIDWNQDGDWDDTGEAIAVNEPLVAGSNTLSVDVSGTAPQGVTYARFRFTSASVATPSALGLMDDGEVEDYAVHLLNPTPVDFCDTVITNGAFENGPTPSTYKQAAEESVEGWATIPDDPASGANFFQRNQIEIWRSGFLGVPAYEGDYFAELNSTVVGTLYQDVSLTPGSSYNWKLAHRGRSGTDTMNVLMGAPGAMTLQATLSTDNSAWVPYSGTYTVPAGEYITRFGFQATGGSGNFLDALSIPGGCDFGDAPDSYGTLSSSSGAAYHLISGSMQLGAVAADPETAGLPSVLADGDDADANDDEDAISGFDLLTTLNDSYSVEVEASNSSGITATIGAWIDFDISGTFDADEYASTTLASGISGGTVTLIWTNIPADITASDTYLRLRMTTELLGSSDGSGKKSNGEVEDYAITIVSQLVTGRVYIDTNSDGVNDAAEAGISNTVVVLRDNATGVCRSVATDATGAYAFAQVLDGNYELYQAHQETTPTPQSCVNSNSQNPFGYQSTTADVLSVTMNMADVVGQDFGEVSGNAFSPDHNGVVSPGSTVAYAHLFSSGGDGTVSFNPVGDLEITAGWSATLYQDSDCNGSLDATEASTPVNNTMLNVTAGNNLCLINNVRAPSNAIAQEQYRAIITANFSYADGTIPSNTLTVTDLTVATAPGVSTLTLKKTVQNLTSGSAETSVVNQASPGDTLQYRITYSNGGAAVITDVVVNDEVPPFTTYVAGSAICNSTPAGMTCTAAANDPSVVWDIPGTLSAGATGDVIYQVEVDY